MPDPLAYFITWTTRGSWLHGDERGWVEAGKPGVKPPNLDRWMRELAVLHDDPVVLSQDQRQRVTQTIEAHCRIRHWTLHAVNVRSNHIHVVVTASTYPPEKVMEQLKAWCSRRLSESTESHRKWWTRHGSTRWINDEHSLAAAIDYVLHHQ